jgi:hypothetical protein
LIEALYFKVGAKVSLLVGVNNFSIKTLFQ